MSFTDHKITQFQHKIADLPDEPQIPAAELKSRFDACPEELRQSLNAICDDAARLEARVEGIVVDTFGDTIDKEMLSDELAAELDAKATQTDLTALDARVDTLEDALPEKCEVYCGKYTGSGGSNRTINVPENAQAAIIHDTSTYETHVILQGENEGGFRFTGTQLRCGISSMNTSNHDYFYLCFCF